MNLDFTILRRAGIPQEFFATICKVSTPAVNKWVKGGEVHVARKKAVARLLQIFGDALERGELPCVDMGRNEKRAHLKKILLTALRPSAQE